METLSSDKPACRRKMLKRQTGVTHARIAVVPPLYGVTHRLAGMRLRFLDDFFQRHTNSRGKNSLSARLSVRLCPLNHFARFASSAENQPSPRVEVIIVGAGVVVVAVAAAAATAAAARAGAAASAGMR